MTWNLARLAWWWFFEVEVWFLLRSCHRRLLQLNKQATEELRTEELKPLWLWGLRVSRRSEIFQLQWGFTVRKKKKEGGGASPCFVRILLPEASCGSDGGHGACFNSEEWGVHRGELWLQAGAQFTQWHSSYVSKFPHTGSVPAKCQDIW